MRHPVALTATLCSILLAWCACACALDPSLDVSQYAHTGWKIREGFTKGTINSMAQTPDGYLWLGTEFGLFRFDGVRKVPWQPPSDQHLPSNSILGLLTARDGTLWIGAVNGLASWKGGKLTLYPELAGQYVWSLLEDREGTIWVGALGTPNGRLCAIRNGRAHCEGEDGSLGGGVFGLYEDSSGSLWAGVMNGLWRWKPGSAKFYPLPGQRNGIRALAEDADGALLIAMPDGIRRLVGKKAELTYPISGNGRLFEVERMLRDRDGGLWVGTDRHGIVHLHHGKTDFFTQADGLSGPSPHHLFEDREGNIWVSTLDGLDRFHDFGIATFTAKQGLLDSLVGSVQADRDGSIWLGTFSGLNRWNEGQITTYGRDGANGKADGKLNGQNPNSLFQDAQGRVWASTHGAIGYLENDRFIPVTGTTSGYVHALADDNARGLWFADQDLGLLHWQHGVMTQEIPWVALGNNGSALALIGDRTRGGLWLGFFKGGIAYFTDGGIRESYSTANGLGGGRVTSLRLDPDGTLWAATEGGLSRLKNGRVATLTSKNGLPCDTVHWVIEDDDHSFWLYMPCGLVRVARSELDAWAEAADRDQSSQRTIQATVLDSSYGIRSRAIPGYYYPQVTKSPDGKLWFAAVDGVSVVDPHHLPFNKLLPPVHIEQITADHKTYEATPDASGQVRLPPRVRDLQIDYTALSFVAPEKVLFRYKLEGWDRDWQDAGTRRQAFYSNLPPRNYRFRVMACNNSGVWNEAGTSLDFSIAPAYYQTNWFRALCAAAFLAVLWGLYRMRVGQLRAQEEKFREAIESIPAMAFVSLPNGYRTFVNRGWVEYTGMTVEQSLGSGWHAVIHPEDLKRVLGEWEAALAGGTPMYYEARYRRAEDGQYRWFMVRVVPQRNKRGKIVKWFGTVTDIEDSKRAAEALQRSQFYISEGQRVASMGSWAFNAGGFEYWSSELFRIHGLDPSGKPPTVEEYLALVHPEDRTFMKQGIARMLDDHLAFDFTKRIVRPDGAIRHIRCVGVPVTQGGTFQGFLGTGMDVTEQEQLTGELRRSESHLAEAQKLTHTGSWAWRVADRKTTHLSEEFYRICGFDPAVGALTLEQCSERVHPEDRLEWKSIIERAIVEKADYDREFRIVLPNGTVTWIHTVGHPVLSDTGDLEGFVGSSTDITALKSAEQEREKLRQLEAELAHTNRVSTLGEMAASLAHEIKQPIAAAITSANTCMEWLAHEPPNLDRARAAAGRIDKYGNRAAEIIDRIRSLYKKSPPQRELVDVNEIIEEMLTLLKCEADRYSIAMRTELAAELPKITADRVQLQQVFMNLMLNAIEAMKDLGGELTVKSQLQDGQLQFSVSDTGVGLPTEKMEQIFSAFYTTKQQGSGMGLAISRSIVESHGGRLWATANDGRGATFHFTLPAAAEILQVPATGT